MASAKKYYVFSTLSNDQTYRSFSTDTPGVLTPTHSVEIKGGAGVANKRLITPLGVATEVSEDDLAFLKAHKCFQIHEKNGFIAVRAKSADVEKVAADMARNDGCAPFTPETILTNAKKGVKLHEFAPV